MSGDANVPRQTPPRTVARQPWIWLTALAAICLIVFALWAPFGLRRAAWGDAWSYYGPLLGGGTLAPLLNSRPLNWLPWQVSYGLVPTSFLGLNLLIAWLILLKGVLVYAIVRILAPGAIGLALAAALLATVYPAEVGYFFDGFVNLHQGFDAYLLAVFLLLAYWKRRSLWLLIAGAAALAFSVATYEAVLALAVVTPLLLLWLDRRVSRRLIRTTMIWWVPVGIYVLYIVALRFSNAGLNAREAGLLESGLNVPNLPLELLGATIWNLGQRYVEGWRIAVTLSPFNGSSPVFQTALIAGALVAAIFFLHAKVSRTAPSQPGRRWPPRRWVELFLLSILWTMLGYAVFSLASVRYDGWRLGFYTVLGSSLTVALVLYGATAHRRIGWALAVGCAILAVALLISRAPLGLIGLTVAAGVGFALPRPLNMAVVLGVLLTISVSRQLDLLRWLTSESLAVQQLLTEVAEATPGLRPGTPVVLVAEAEIRVDALPFDTSSHFDMALDLMHDDPGYIGILCPVEVAEWGWNEESCAFAADGLMVRVGDNEQTIPYESLVLVAADTDGVVRLVDTIPEAWGVPPETGYQPWALLDADAPLPPRLATLFNPRPLIDR